MTPSLAGRAHRPTPDYRAILPFAVRSIDSHRRGDFRSLLLNGGKMVRPLATALPLL